MPRRVITGFDAKGKSVFVSDGEPKVPTHIWETYAPPASIAVDGEPKTPQPTDPPPGGTRLRIVSIPPLPPERRNVPGDRSGMHATQSVDYIFILSGEVYLVLDDDVETLLKPGDCVIQRGTMHAWRNKGNVPCVFAAVLVSAVNDRYPIAEPDRYVPTL